MMFDDAAEEVIILRERAAYQQGRADGLREAFVIAQGAAETFVDDIPGWMGDSGPEDDDTGTEGPILVDIWPFMGTPPDEWVEAHPNWVHSSTIKDS